MSIIEQAEKRLAELKRAGVQMPWRAAGMVDTDLHARIESAVEPANSGVHFVDDADRAMAPTLRKVLPLHESAAPQARTVGALDSQRRSASIEIDFARLERSGFLVPNAGRSDLSEEFRQIKRPLLKNVFAKPAVPGNRAPLVMVTSAIPGEGKTFSSINLAMSIAMEIDTSVLLVDADVVRPSVPACLGFTAGRGLLDLLQDDSIELADVMLRTNVPKLSILPAGTPNSRSTELLASDAMERLLVELANKYADRVIIFDAPPLLLTTEARVLASRVGQVVLVVDAGRTPRTVVSKAFAAVENCSTVMSMLNRCDDVSQVSGHHYYYG